MSSTGFIKGLVEEGIRQLIKDEVKAKLDELFPRDPKSGAAGYAFTEYQRKWRDELGTVALDILHKDPEVQSMIRGKIVEFIKGGIAKIDS